MLKPWFCLMGPTASGKTALACELVQQFPFEIISIDSVMIYRGMDIGSAKPDAAILQQAPHHLLDILSPNETYSVAQCQADVLRIGEQIEAQGRIPLLVGGTMMYFRALTQGLSTLPPADAKIRENLLCHDGTFLYQRLREVDFESADRIHPNDSQRILRALEVYELTQKPLSQWLKISAQQPLKSFVHLKLMPEDRAWLHQRIAQRFTQMLQMGLIEEVRELITTYALTAQHPSMRCVGYRQVWDFLYDHQDEELLLEKGIAATRQLAKRQLTWLRHWPQGRSFAVDKLKNIQEMIAFIQRIAHNEGIIFA